MPYRRRLLPFPPSLPRSSSVVRWQRRASAPAVQAEPPVVTAPGRLLPLSLLPSMCCLSRGGARAPLARRCSGDALANSPLLLRSPRCTSSSFPPPSHASSPENPACETCKSSRHLCKF
ncbi:hypothetical protein BDA96_02G301400 [Sorghum bicolor]|uniref:Uncharacterized protein n=2 Tax=Sorghum bicolor TaxID=4558 RepID=A0A921RRX0_SORBI|nr:hypothetical protein SORBI_3002G286300 [Sorghum bicolor]KAG0544728.1 hypothetical protein BDA96_02G301400 [Sorghum bicolor]